MKEAILMLVGRWASHVVFSLVNVMIKEFLNTHIALLSDRKNGTEDTEVCSVCFYVHFKSGDRVGLKKGNLTR